MQILKSGYSESAHKISAYEVVLFIHGGVKLQRGSSIAILMSKFRTFFPCYGLNYIHTPWMCASTVNLIQLDIK